MIPFERYSDLMFTENLKLFITENISKEQEKLPDDPAIVILIRDAWGHIVGCNCRSLKPENTFAKYIKAKVNEDVQLIYGVERLQTDKNVYVFEGEFNSMFLENGIAVGGVGMMHGIENVLGVNKESVIQVVDNDPRNPQVVKALEGLIDAGYNVVIMPGNIDDEDVNDMMKNHKLSSSQIKQIIDENTYSGLNAKLKMTEWKKCRTMNTR
jgi:Icc-related predicted phosphoesterase